MAWIATGITLLALALRLFRLGQWSLWIDELYSIRHAERILRGGIRASDSHHPIYYLLVVPLFRQFGIDEWSARLPAALIGTITIPVLIFALAPISGIATALILGLILAISPWHIYWSQNARFYTLTFLFQALALIALYQFGETGQAESLLFYLLFYALAILAHETSALTLFIAALYLLAIGQASLDRIALVLALPTIFSAILFFTLGHSFHHRVEHIRRQWREHFRHRRAHPVAILAGALRYINPALVCIALVGSVNAMTQPRHLNLWLGLIELAPLILATLWAFAAYSATRYAFIALLGFALAAAQLTQTAWAIADWLGAAIFLVIVVASIDDLYLYYFVQQGNRAPLKKIILAMKKQIADSDRILSTAPDLAQYYLDHSIGNLFDENIALELKDKTWFILDDTFEHLPVVTQDWIAQHTQIIACETTRFHWRVWTITLRV